MMLSSAVDGGDDENMGSVGFPEREFIYRLLTGLRRLKDILENSGTVIQFGTLVKLLKKVLHGIRIPFHGEPLGGVQVMGVLETRALDFETVIWLSMNEGIFPARQTGSSFIPFSLRRGHGLPGNEQHEAVWAYYFYRMLQRARRTILVYNTRSEGCLRER
jgi:inactivated superfamily I helicase